MASPTVSTSTIVLTMNKSTMKLILFRKTSSSGDEMNAEHQRVGAQGHSHNPDELSEA
jgi:hypothetical protein